MSHPLRLERAGTERKPVNICRLSASAATPKLDAGSLALLSDKSLRAQRFAAAARIVRCLTCH